MNIIVLGIDLAKIVFALHGVGQSGKPELVRPRVAREQLLELVASLPPCLIGMEACSGAHHWARQFQALGHTVRLMAPKFVAPQPAQRSAGQERCGRRGGHLRGGATTQHALRAHQEQTAAKRAVPASHPPGIRTERTATYNRIRGLISEFGIVLPLKIERLRVQIRPHLDSLPPWALRCVTDLLAHTTELERRIDEYDRLLKQLARDDAQARALMTLPGIGPTTAGALAATLGNGHDFRNGRQVAAWLGLVPGQYSSGGKVRLGRITKAGDTYTSDRC